MGKRFVSIWLPYLKTDFYAIRKPELRNIPFVLCAPDHGRMMITAANRISVSKDIHEGMVLADARTIIPNLEVFDDKPGLSVKLLNKLAEWCIRFTPFAAIDEPDGLILDVTGCSHLWGGDTPYLTEITNRLKRQGYFTRTAMADTIGAAWALARYGKEITLIKNGMQANALFPLPPEALRFEKEIVERLHKLGLSRIRDLIAIPRPVIRRRFGNSCIRRLNQALGQENEEIQPVVPIEPYQERLPCLEPIVTATGIEIALQRLLESLCNRLRHEEKGIRKLILKCYRVDGAIESIEIGTHRPSYNPNHLFKLFENKISSIEPGLGIELFAIEAPGVEAVTPLQEKIWKHAGGLKNTALGELLDRVANKIGTGQIHRYLPDEHYLPERSVKLAVSIDEELTAAWNLDRPRPIQLLATPEKIEVTAPIPDYPPMLFRYRGKLHKIIKADGPERIEQEWWIKEGRHRDYYQVEDEIGNRYWLFRSGHYSEEKAYCWFLHGFFG